MLLTVSLTGFPYSLSNVWRLVSWAVYWISWAFFKLLLSVFFSHVDVAGVERVPLDGPVVLVGNHSNQFLDGLVLLTTCPRPISFLIAEVSLRRWFVGLFARAIRSIPVVRPQDTIAKAKGQIRVVRELNEYEIAQLGVRSPSGGKLPYKSIDPAEKLWLIEGKGTDFMRDVSEAQLIVAEGATSKPYVVVVESKTRMTVCGALLFNDESEPATARSTSSGSDSRVPVVASSSKRSSSVYEDTSDEQSSEDENMIESGSDSAAAQWHSFSVQDKPDHQHMFQRVWDALGRGRCIGIFPEGGSHDQTHLLPLKAGVAIMALGAAHTRGAPVKIVACGLTYVRPYRFRSHAMVQFGQPFSVPNSLLHRYAEGQKREAASALLDVIESRLRAVTLNVPDYETLQMVRTARRLYQPPSTVLTIEKYLELERRFALIFEKCEQEPIMRGLASRLQQYRTKLHLLGLRDSQVEWLNMSEDAGITLIGRMFYLFLVFLVTGPSIILNLPIAGICKAWAVRQARLAMKRSKVKVLGADTVASYKILCGMAVVPIAYTLYSILIVYYFGGTYLSWKHLPLVFVALVTCSYLSVTFLEELGAQWKITAPLIWSIFSFRYTEEFGQLRKERVQLRQRVREVVEKLGPSLGEEFWERRIIGADVFEETMDDQDDASDVDLAADQALDRLDAAALKSGGPSSSDSSRSNLYRHQLAPRYRVKPVDEDLFDVEDIFL